MMTMMMLEVEEEEGGGKKRIKGRGGTTEREVEGTAGWVWWLHPSVFVWLCGLDGYSRIRHAT